MLTDNIQGRAHSLGLPYADSHIDVWERAALLRVRLPHMATTPGTVAPPVASPLPGDYQNSVNVSLLAESGATIKYTTDGTNPTTSATAAIFSTAFTITSTTTVRAYAYKADVESAVADFAYTITLHTPADPNPPVASPIPGSYQDSVTVTLTATSADTIKYTVDGSDPRVTGVTYTVPFELIATTTVRAYVVRGDQQSVVVDMLYTITAIAPPPSPPVSTPIPGSYQDVVTVTLLAQQSDVIKYTLDGSSPLTSGITYTGPIVLVTSKTIRAYALRGADASGISVLNYTVAIAPTEPLTAILPRNHPRALAIPYVERGLKIKLRSD